MSSQAGGRYQRSAGGMVGAMLVLLLVVGAYVLLRDLNRVDPSSPVRSVEYTLDVRYAEREADFEVLAPPALPAGWRATTASYVPGEDERWSLSLLTDQERYVGVEQAARSSSAMVGEFVDADAVRGEPVDVAGEPWQRWRDSGGDLALVRQREGITTLVVGHRVSAPRLADFAASLR